jgi:hypothetical protein
MRQRKPLQALGFLGWRQAKASRMSLTKFTKAVNRIAHDVWASVMKHVASVCYEAHLTMG